MTDECNGRRFSASQKLKRFRIRQPSNLARIGNALE
jgi:hypothetical protein